MKAVVTLIGFVLKMGDILEIMKAFAQMANTFGCLKKFSKLDNSLGI